MTNCQTIARMLVLSGVLAAGLSAAAEIFDTIRRQIIDIPPNVPPVLRGEMVTFLGVLRDVRALSAKGRFSEAGDLAER